MPTSYFSKRALDVGEPRIKRYVLLVPFLQAFYLIGNLVRFRSRRIFAERSTGILAYLFFNRMQLFFQLCLEVFGVHALIVPRSGAAAQYASCYGVGTIGELWSLLIISRSVASFVVTTSTLRFTKVHNRSIWPSAFCMTRAS